ADAHDRGDDRDGGGDEGAEHDREDEQGGDDAEHLTGAEGDVGALEDLPAQMRLERSGVRLIDQVLDLLDGGLGEAARLPGHVELGDDRGAVLGAGAGGEVIDGGGRGLALLDLPDLLHERVDLLRLVLDGGAVLGEDDGLAGGAAHLGEGVGEGVDVALPLGARDLEVRGEGAAEADGETADDEQPDDPGADDLPAERGHAQAETVQGRGHATSRTSTAGRGIALSRRPRIRYTSVSVR